MFLNYIIFSEKRKNFFEIFLKNLMLIFVKERSFGSTFFSWFI